MYGSPLHEEKQHAHLSKLFVNTSISFSYQINAQRHLEDLLLCYFELPP